MPIDGTPSFRRCSSRRPRRSANYSTAPPTADCCRPPPSTSTRGPSRRRPHRRGAACAWSSCRTAPPRLPGPAPRRRRLVPAPGDTPNAAPPRRIPHGAARRAHRTAEPDVVRGRSCRCLQADRARRQRGGALPRPRPLQERQRHARPSGRRRAAQAGRRRDCGAACARPTRSRASAATNSPSSRRDGDQPEARDRAGAPR